MTVVQVALLGEGTDVWRPAQTRHIQGAVYELIGSVPDGETWQFSPGQIVECEEHALSGGSSALVACRPVAV